MVAYRRIHRRRPSRGGWEGGLAVTVLQVLGAGWAGGAYFASFDMS